MDGIIADIFIILSILVLLATAGITIYSVVRSLRANRRPENENGVPVRKIELATVAGVIIVSLPSLLFGSFTDMCIITAVILLVAASIAVIAGRIISLKLRKRA